MTATDAIKLVSGDSACEIAPDLGGAILNLSVAGIDLLRRSSPKPSDVLDAACFTMLPFANRVDHGRFTFQGRTISIGTDPAGAPHALHGHGWRRRWTPIERSGDRVTLAFRHDGRGWPWPYRAEQRILLTDGGLRFEVTIENLHASDAMPCGVGLHPYFARTSASQITANATSCWRNDETGLAIEEFADHRFSAAGYCPVESLEGTDNFFRSNGGGVIVNASTRLSGSAVTGFHVYVPVGEDFFCVEPVSHAPNSFGRGDIRDDEIIVSGERRTWQFNIEAMTSGATF